jgi:hypothetical protein
MAWIRTPAGKQDRSASYALRSVVHPHLNFPLDFQLPNFGPAGETGGAFLVKPGRAVRSSEIERHVNAAISAGSNPPS